jgi:lysophospholipase L1-like esterase
MRVFSALVLLMLAAQPVRSAPVTIFLAGDSTAAEKVAERRPETGWGEKLPKFFDDKFVRIENLAKNGRSTRTFMEEGRWQSLLGKVQPGDYVFIQFGHNDSVREKASYTQPDDYRRNLETFVADVRARQGNPVLLTPAMRRGFDARGDLLDTHGTYPDIVRKLAADQAVPLIDMHRDSARVLREYGVEESKKLFLILDAGVNPNYPQGVQDNTHFSPLGAEEMAALAIDTIRQLIPDLAQHLKDKPTVALRIERSQSGSVTIAGAWWRTLLSVRESLHS